MTKQLTKIIRSILKNILAGVRSDQRFLEFYLLTPKAYHFGIRQDRFTYLRARLSAEYQKQGYYEKGLRVLGIRTLLAKFRIPLPDSLAYLSDGPPMTIEEMRKAAKTAWKPLNQKDPQFPQTYLNTTKIKISPEELEKATRGQSLQEYIDQLKNYPDRGDDS